MSELLLPLILAATGFMTALIAYRGIRRGGARFYTLEREAMLRRASFTLLGSVLLFLAAIGLLVYQQQQLTAEEAAESGEAVEGVATNTATPSLVTFPPTETPSPTPDLTQPTPTPTAVICRAQIEGTSGNGLTLRDAPGGAEINVLPEGSLVIMLDDEAQEANDFVWRKVRVTGGNEGWVASEFLTLGSGCR